jgi:hypothetical protein
VSTEEIVNLLSTSEPFTTEGTTKTCDSSLGRVGRARIVSVPWIGARRKSQVEYVDEK